MDGQMIIIIVLVVWLLVISGIISWFIFKLSKFLKSSDEKNLVKVLDKIAKSQKENRTDIAKLFKNIERIDEENLSNINRVGLIRFNPFDEIGGDHSFSMALLDGRKTGIVITGLHTRERTRLYVKPIKKGKSEYELSKEENKAIEKALN